MTTAPETVTLAMHIPDNFISPSTGALFWVVMIPVWFLCMRAVMREATPEKMAYLGAGAAFSFLIMMFNVPTPGGTTAHGVGAALIALLLGPQYATVAVSVALLLQALLFGDGGLITLGANCFNMGVVLPFAAYGLYAGIRGTALWITGRRTAGESAGGSARPAAATASSVEAAVAAVPAGVDRVAQFVAGYVGITLAALCVAIELGVQPLLFRAADGQSLYFPFGLAVTVPAMLIPHLAVAGVVEGLMTVAVVDFVRRTAPEIVRSRVAVGDVAGGVRGDSVQTVADVVPGSADAGASDVLANATNADTVFAPASAQARTAQPRSGLRRSVWIALAAVALLSPISLIATGDAWGEWGAEDFMAATGLDYVPQYIAHGFSWNALLPDYSLAGLPDIAGYLLSAVIGIAVTTIVFRLLALAVSGRNVRK
ncbi:cobalt transporter CbiM [Bifidobacterium biavatii]|uniref:Cobalt transport protein CbiM n=1 Tax=Bifidobacterium biavatii DSM 23969 TaxID=1437608 RepID=A0A086ZN96_9BIFI|nr:cobalt transporter CbiM [Bifidobacterium biavatii]KFI47996.1 cobalt transport protein CbiM [Bifidobacterium biavatii DSM 23969]